MQIAHGELSAICRAVGIMTPKDSAELHNLPMTVTVKLKKREDKSRDGRVERIMEMLLKFYSSGSAAGMSISAGC